MKTILPVNRNYGGTCERVDFIFYHDAEVSIVRALRPVAASTYLYKPIEHHKSERVQEMEFVVVRFPKHMKPNDPTALQSALSRLFYVQWQEVDEQTLELQLDGANLSKTFIELERAGIFRFALKAHADFSSGQYLPHYRQTACFGHHLVNVLTMTLSIPHVLGILVNDSRKRRKGK